MSDFLASDGIETEMSLSEIFSKVVNCIGEKNPIQCLRNEGILETPKSAGIGAISQNNQLGKLGG